MAVKADQEKAAKSVQRALRKVEREREKFLSAKGNDVVPALEVFEKAKKSYGRALNKAEGLL